MASLMRGAPILRSFPRCCWSLPSSSLVGRVTLPLGAACRNRPVLALQLVRYQQITTSTRLRDKEDDASSKPKELSQNAADKEEQETIRAAQRKEYEKPWHRAGTEASTEHSDESADPTRGDHTKGRLLTTPTRLLKLILPIPSKRIGTSQKDGEDANPDGLQPLALLVHPQQPLSYLERLLQAELPPIKVDGNERIPNITFRAEAEQSNEKSQGAEQKKNVETYSDLGREGPRRKDENSAWVRWSTSTEVGDFIRDAARGREFAIDIEGYDEEVRVAVPSFNDRTYYMRVRLRKMSKEINSLSQLKQECDTLAHRGAHRMAKGGFGVLTAWWGLVYYLSFHTEPGWDLVEPVTYLVGLTTIMGGYLWFLYISRDLNYRAILNVTVSRRQNALYQAKGFDIERWEHLVHDVNGLRKEIRFVANEYDADWDETKDLGGEEVVEVLEKEKKAREERKGRQKKEEEGKERNKKDEKKGESKSS